MVYSVNIKDITSMIDPEWISNEYFISKGEPSFEIYPHKVRTNFYLLFHMVEGWMDVRIGEGEIVRIEKGMMLAISPEITAQDIACSDSYTAHAICFTKDFILKNIAGKYTLDFFTYFSYNAYPIIKVNDENKINLLQLYNIMKSKRYEISSEAHLDLLRALFFSYLYEALIIYNIRNGENDNNPFKLSVKEMDIYMSFKLLISNNVQHNRDLKFYACGLSVTPKHLIKLIKNITGSTPKNIINDSLIALAKNRLTYTASSILLISEELNFSSSPAFCRFFKQKTGMTPYEFRNSTS
ncbi:helix-turn-helix domain-containing protein [Chryseobacterium sp. MEBOG07]|uniref:helix-turn-helix domain-containing protein n=1 Tax=Chryseobacterium sp. MEBOG07 TaxID=2879939 RepID=UPI001F260D2B|nr:AraC family transcriptional regulator [Chryseobacterium sp. MEBOG07]UKB81632.1 AraC family transcriptional regulator [Chryseobacterium sp. MEBOG07]